jgi:ABC-2 type transport system permease protein
MLILAVLGLHLLALAAALTLKSPAPMPRSGQVFLTTALLAFAFTTMLSRSLLQAIEALYTRRDMELLLTSPVPPTSVMGVRAVGVATAVAAEAALFIWPFANVFVAFGHLDWAKAYILVPAFGLLTASLALSISLGLFRYLGPGRTRVFGQVLAALAGIGTFAVGFVGPRTSRNTLATLSESVTSNGALIWMPAEAILDGVLAPLAIATASVVLFVGTVRLLGDRFTSAALQSSSTTVSPIRTRSSDELRFHAGVRRALILKELRLLRRDPALLSRLIFELVFLVPVAFTLWKQHSGEGVPWIWLTAIMIVGSVASAFSWVMFAGEDVPDLVAAAPVPKRAILRAKVEATLLTVVPIIVLPLIVLAPSRPVFGLALAACSTGCAFSCALLNSKAPPDRKRSEFNRRHKRNAGHVIAELMVMSAWIGACVVLTLTSPWP